VYKQLKWIEKDPWMTSLKKQKERKNSCGFLGKGERLVNMCGRRETRKEILMNSYRYNT
jgi:hypothetical protein